MQEQAYIRVEFDPKFDGDEYHGVGQFALIPLLHDTRDQASDERIEKMFEEKTGHPKSCIIHYTRDELYNDQGVCLEKSEPQIRAFI